MTMETRDYTVRFLTPAFLGDAQQNGRWRTPPFKHLLREWWRVAWATDNDPTNWRRMRELEGRLLGHAWLENDRDHKGRKVSARRSEVRMRLVPWQPGTLRSIPQTRPAAQRAPASAFYLGYGPVKGAAELKMAHPLAEGESARWMLAWPNDAQGARYLEQALGFIHRYGALGGRSRNGWGSVQLHLSPCGGRDEGGGLPSRDWQACLREQWAHAIGQDEQGPLIWRLPSRKEWKRVIEDLAAIRKAVNGIARNRAERMILNQPVGGAGGRVPSNLRFKVRQDKNGQLYGVIFHMPFLPPNVDARSAQRIWPKVHRYLDQKLTRSPA